MENRYFIYLLSYPGAKYHYPSYPQFKSLIFYKVSWFYSPFPYSVETSIEGGGMREGRVAGTHACRLLSR
jgi:hypothetical protein